MTYDELTELTVEYLTFHNEKLEREIAEMLLDPKMRPIVEASMAVSAMLCPKLAVQNGDGDAD